MSDKMVVYREVVPQDRIFYLVMNGVILLLVIITLIFIFTNIWQGAISSGLTAIFIVFWKNKTKEAEIVITDREFVVRLWPFTVKTNLSEIDRIEIKDVTAFPEPYRRHIKVWGRGIRFVGGLRLFKLRSGDAVHIKTKSGQTIIVTPKDNQKLIEVLKRQREALK